MRRSPTQRNWRTKNVWFPFERSEIQARRESSSATWGRFPQPGVRCRYSPQRGTLRRGGSPDRRGGAQIESDSIDLGQRNRQHAVVPTQQTCGGGFVSTRQFGATSSADLHTSTASRATQNGTGGPIDRRRAYANSGSLIPTVVAYRRPYSFAACSALTPSISARSLRHHPSAYGLRNFYKIRFDNQPLSNPAHPPATLYGLAPTAGRTSFQ